MATNADRRLQRLRNDPNYSAKLSRLTKTQQRSVEQLIRDNKGREARSRINELDEARRTAVATRSKKRRVLTKRQLVTARLLALHAGKPKLRAVTIRRGVSAMSNDEQNMILKFSEADLAAHVSREIRIPQPPGIINPYFYQ